MKTFLFKIKDKFRQLFCRIEVSEAIDRKFVFITNIYGDSINKFNSRSLWKDKKGRLWLAKNLYV